MIGREADQKRSGNHYRPLSRGAISARWTTRVFFELEAAFHVALRRFVAHGGGDRRGSVAVEFALVGGLLIELIVFVMQCGFYFYASSALQNATAKAVRQILTGTVTNQAATAAQFRTNYLCPSLPAGLSCANVITNVQSVAEDVYPNGFYKYVNSSQTAVVLPAMDNTKTSFCAGNAGSVIYVQVFYALPVFDPVWRTVGRSVFKGTPSHFVSTGVVFKNEPFQSSSSGSC